MTVNNMIFKREGLLAASSGLKELINKVKSNNAITPVELSVYIASSAESNNASLCKLPQYSTIQSFTVSHDLVLTSYSENIELIVETKDLESGITRKLSVPIKDNHLVTPLSKGNELNFEVDFYIADDYTLYCKCSVTRGRELCVRTIENLVQLDLELSGLNSITELELAYISLFNYRILSNLVQGTKRFLYINEFYKQVEAVSHLVPSDLTASLGLLRSFLDIKEQDADRALGMTVMANSAMVSITQQVGKAITYNKVGI